MAPALGVTFGLVSDLGTIVRDASSANLTQAVSDVLKTPADLVGDLLNGYVNPNAATNPTGLPFTGLLNKGSLLDDLLSTWPQQLAVALNVTTPAAPAATAVAANHRRGGASSFHARSDHNHAQCRRSQGRRTNRYHRRHEDPGGRRHQNHRSRRQDRHRHGD
jgi:hypothetical protein